jgi:hypothetical protein
MSPTATRKKTTARTATRSAKGAVPRTMTSAHKRALSEGRAMSATVDRYLAAVNTPKRRGRKVSKATLESRLAQARIDVKTTVGVDRVLAAQAVRDLQSKLAQLNSSVDVKTLEASFVKIAKSFSENRGIGYAAWRDAGVPPQVLKRAGITRTRG